ncbi:NAD(P)-dependent oxidoreductase [Thalassolituus sp.]|jgi:3-hydroxyisobutyrate dehydrogenase-like beta-hydroxyacid dehydrogenase|uniref:NAD(P)-dependent oxidoreductase n=1 Tax=Thalassolituus sp. TaxID=2030822 RepID=UPI0035154EC3
MANIVFIGLGNMGAPMAAHLATAGHSLTVHNRSPEKTHQWLSKNPGTELPAGSPLPEDTDAVILCVSKDSDVREWLIDNGIIKNLKPGAVIIDHSTTSSSLAEEMARTARKYECHFCDIPVSGGQQGAQSGQLTLMAGCDEKVTTRVSELCKPYTRAFERMGPPGAGQKTKMVNQICVAGLIQSLAEGVNFAEKNGLDTTKVMALLSQGAAGSWQMSNRHSTMIQGDYDHGFAVSLMHKDLQICLRQAEESRTEIPVARLVDEYYAELEASGHGQKDTSALLLRLQSDLGA